MGIYNKLSELKEKTKPEADWVDEFRGKYSQFFATARQITPDFYEDDIKQFIAKLLIAQRKKDLEEIMFETSFDFRAWQVVAKEKQGVWLRLKDLKKTILKLSSDK